MANSRSGQQYPSNYTPVEQGDPSLRLQSAGVHHTQFSQPTHDFDSVSSIHEDEQGTYELSNRRDPHIPSGSLSRSTSAAIHHDGHKQPPVNIHEDRAYSSPRKEWKSWKIEWPFTTVALVVEISLIVAIIALDQVSSRHGGIVTVPDLAAATHQNSMSTIFTDVRQYVGLLWTALPSFVFALYALAFAAVVAACYERQPFIELNRGGSVRNTIMLDYRAYPGIYNWVVACIHSHWHLCYAMVLSLIVHIVIVPLSSHLLVASIYAKPSNVNLSFTTRFDDSISIATTNLQPFVDIATAVHAYGSTPPSWMTVEYAFAPFSASALSSVSSSGVSPTNISATTDAYSAYLDCRAIDGLSYTATYKSAGVVSGFDVGDLTIQFPDRSCSLSQSLPLSNATQTYLQSWQETCSGRTDSRIGILAGTYSSSSANKLQNISVISCTTSYWHSTGLLTVSLDSASSVKSNYISYTEKNITNMTPMFAYVFEAALPQYFFFNAAATTRSDALGFAILSAAQRSANNDAVAAMNTGLLLNTTQRVFTTLYAGLATTSLLVPAPAAINGSGVSYQAVTRLFVVRPIAYTIVAVLLLALVCHLVLWTYSARHTSVLKEEPIGLLGNAILLERSDVNHVLNQARPSGEGNNTRSTLKKTYNVDRAECYWDAGENRIRVVGLTRK